MNSTELLEVVVFPQTIFGCDRLKAWQAGELALLFSTQAALEARSRLVLVFFGLSLYFDCATI